MEAVWSPSQLLASHQENNRGGSDGGGLDERPLRIASHKHNMDLLSPLTLITRQGNSALAIIVHTHTLPLPSQRIQLPRPEVARMLPENVVPTMELVSVGKPMLGIMYSYPQQD